MEKKTEPRAESSSGRQETEQRLAICKFPLLARLFLDNQLELRYASHSQLNKR